MGNSRKLGVGILTKEDRKKKLDEIKEKKEKEKERKKKEKEEKLAKKKEREKKKKEKEKKLAKEKEKQKKKKEEREEEKKESWTGQQKPKEKKNRKKERKKPASGNKTDNFKTQPQQTPTQIPQPNWPWGISVKNKQNQNIGYNSRSSLLEDDTQYIDQMESNDDGTREKRLRIATPYVQNLVDTRYNGELYTNPVYEEDSQIVVSKVPISLNK